MSLDLRIQANEDSLRFRLFKVLHNCDITIELGNETLWADQILEPLDIKIPERPLPNVKLG